MIYLRRLRLNDGPAVCLWLHENVKPRFCKAHFVPYAMWEQVSKEMDKLVKDSAEWATPLVPVLKENASICGE